MDSFYTMFSKKDVEEILREYGFSLEKVKIEKSSPAYHNSVDYYEEEFLQVSLNGAVIPHNFTHHADRQDAQVKHIFNQLVNKKFVEFLKQK